MNDDRRPDRLERGVPEMDERTMGPHVSPSRVAQFWGVHYDTVMRDIRKGALRAYKMPGGQIRIRTRDARAYGRPIE